MHYFVYFTRNEDEPMTPPSPEGMAEMGRFMAESAESGVIVATGQMPMETSHVRLAGDEVTVTDGPFIEGKEFIPGFTVIRADSKQEAIDWAAKLRGFMGDGTLRVAALVAGTYFE